MSTAVIPPPDTIQTKPSVLQRVLSVDAYRGFVMFLMMAEVTRIHSLDSIFKDAGVEFTGFWKFLHFNQNHVPWRGLSLHDMIQPSFSFLVGTAMVFSLFSRYSKGQSFARAAFHALWRSVLLIALGIFLRTQEMFWTSDKARTYFTFEDTLSQIGLGYFFLFLIAHLKPVFQGVAFVVILVGYWLAFVLYPAPGNDYDYAKVGVNQKQMVENHDHPADNTSIAAHFNKNSNLAWAVDRRFLSHFRYYEVPKRYPQNKPKADDPFWFHYNYGGYQTLSFIPTLATMIFGLIAGGWLRISEPNGKKTLRFIIAGAVALAIGLLLDVTGICPSVKRIWTPAWVLVSGGICMFLLAAFYFVIDVKGFSAWSFPLRVIGANSIVAYFLADAWGASEYPHKMLHAHFGEKTFDYFGPQFHYLFLGGMILAIWWLILYWLYRKKIFVKI